MNKTVSKYQMGWVGIRVARLGKSSKFLKRAGYIKLGAADLNNRNGFTFVKPVVNKDEFDAINWAVLANLGLEGIAMWMSDAQWGATASVTDAQWQDRRIIEMAFNNQYPTGKRA